MSELAAIEAKLLAAMLECGASPSLARVKAVEFAAVLNPDILREKLEQDINDMFYKKPRAQLAQEHHVHRSTIYRLRKKLSQAAVVLRQVPC